MLRVLVISDNELEKETVANEIGALLESLKVGVTLDSTSIGQQQERGNARGLLLLRGVRCTISGMVL